MLWTAMKRSIKVQRGFRLIVKMKILQVRTWFAVIENLAVDILLGTTYTDHCIRVIFCDEQKDWANTSPTGTNLR